MSQRTNNSHNTHRNGRQEPPPPAPPPPSPSLLAAPTGPITPPYGPAVHCFVITPSDATPLARRVSGIWVGGAGNVAVIAAADDPAGTPVVFSTVAAGTLLPVCASYVRATGTTATLLVGFG